MWMKQLSEQEFNTKLAKIQEQNLCKERRRKLKDEKKKGNSKRKLPSTSKIILFCVLLLCVEIVLFCEYAMIATDDASSMYVLVGIPAALAPVVWGYYSKAKAENTGADGTGIVFQSMMNEHDAGNNEGAVEETDSVG